MADPVQQKGAETSWGGSNPDEAPEYVFHRLKIWDEALEARTDDRQAAIEANVEINITLPDGKVVKGVKGVTTPHDVAKGISDEFAKTILVALIDDTQQYDMNRVLTDSCRIKFCTFEDTEGKSVFWHSTAHMLGEAMEYKYHGELCIGPPLDDGFYYDIHLGNNEAKGKPTVVLPDQYKDLEKRVEKIAKSKRTFQRLELKKEEAQKMFAYNPFKMELINKMEDGTTITAYRDGPFIDLCRGPHIPNSAMVKNVMVTKTGQAYWLAKAENPSLQRVYGISFPDKKQMTDYKTLLEEAAKRDHRIIGKQQELFMFHTLSPGSCFFLPHGTRIYNTLLEFMRDQYWKRGYTEVHTPNVFDFGLWETSGHAANYRENMFSFEVEGRDFGLKPMNCPSHCLIFKSRNRSYRELPMRLADFGVLHRNEMSGTLTGLTRVRRFQQDDAHIFCEPSQVASEVLAYLDFLKFVYDIFGFTFELDLSTRPEKFLGEIAQWDQAEAELASALEKFTGKKCEEDKDAWKLNPGDGAFYGPKIDIKIYDALRRRHQCATVQLDFQLPIRFDLSYIPQGTQESEKAEEEAHSEEQAQVQAEGKPESQLQTPTQKTRPVIVHRAIFGSVERFFAILTEHYAGKWPLWLSPRQVIVLPVSEKFIDYAKQVQDKVRMEKFYVDVDTSDRKLPKKVREAQLAQYNFILVVGEKEVEENTVNIRTRNNEVLGEKPIDAFVQDIVALRKEYK